MSSSVIKIENFKYRTAHLKLRITGTDPENPERKKKKTSHSCFFNCYNNFLKMKEKNGGVAPLNQPPDQMHYLGFPISLADNKESLFKQRNSLSGSKKNEKRTSAAKKKKMLHEEKSLATTQIEKKKKGGKKGSSSNVTEREEVDRREEEKKQREDKERKERNRKKKEKRQQILTARVDNLVERMSNESMDDKFGSELIDQCYEILSSNHSKESEDKADHPLIQHQDGRKDSVSPLPVTPRPCSSQPAQQFHSLSSTGYRRLPSLDRDVETELAEFIQHQESVRKGPGTEFVPGRLQKTPLRSTVPSERSMNKQFGGKQFTSTLGQPKTTPLRPTTGMKRPRQYPVQQTSDSEDDDKCCNCKRLKEENEQLKRNLEEILNNKGMHS